MDQRRVVKISKYLSRHLRHDPGRIGLTLDEAGWVSVDALLAAMASNNFAVTRAELEHVVAVNDKKRFALDGDRIRAVQGHSVPVVLDHPVADPPEFLYHGTVSAYLEAIRRDGLHPMNRHAVHLSPDRETAHRVGSRRGKPVILTITAARMAADGHEFHLSPNGVWLTATVPPQYLA